MTTNQSAKEDFVLLVGVGVEDRIVNIDGESLHELLLRYLNLAIEEAQRQGITKLEEVFLSVPQPSSLKEKWNKVKEEIGT